MTLGLFCSVVLLLSQTVRQGLLGTLQLAHQHDRPVGCTCGDDVYELSVASSSVHDAAACTSLLRCAVMSV